MPANGRRDLIRRLKVNVSGLHLPWPQCMIQCQWQRHNGVKLKLPDELQAKWDAKY